MLTDLVYDPFETKVAIVRPCMQLHIVLVAPHRAYDGSPGDGDGDDTATAAATTTMVTTTTGAAMHPHRCRPRL